MLEKDIQIKLINGLHARPSASIAGKLAKMDIDFATISTEKITVNARSIMELLTSCILVDTIVHVKVSGKDAETAMKTIEDVLTTNIFI